jgi:hypothetical protein
MVLRAMNILKNICRMQARMSYAHYQREFERTWVRDSAETPVITKDFFFRCFPLIPLIHLSGYCIYQVTTT